jgi:hypothetical protein
VITSFLAANEPEPGPFLMVEDRLDRLVEMDDPSEVATLGGKMLRECGAQTFEMESVGIDYGGYALLPLSNENAPSFRCVFRRSAREGFALDVWMTRAGNAPTP